VSVHAGIVTIWATSDPNNMYRKKTCYKKIGINRKMYKLMTPRTVKEEQFWHVDYFHMYTR